MAKRVTLYGVLTALCMIFGYIESTVPLFAGIPGLKLGAANSVALLLAVYGDIKGAFAVNITRILLSAFLFSTPFALVFSLTAGVISLAVMCLLRKLSCISVIGMSAVGAAVHNTVQLAAAYFIFGAGVVYYLPFLLFFGTVNGTVLGILCRLILKKIKTNAFF